MKIIFEGSPAEWHSTFGKYVVTKDLRLHHSDAHHRNTFPCCDLDDDCDPDDEHVTQEMMEALYNGDFDER